VYGPTEKKGRNEDDSSFELGWKDSSEGKDDKLSLTSIEVEVLEGYPCEIIQQAHGNMGGEVRTRDRLGVINMNYS